MTYRLEYVVVNQDSNAIIQKNHIPIGFCKEINSRTYQDFHFIELFLQKFNEFHILCMNSLLFESNINQPTFPPQSYNVIDLIPPYIDSNNNYYEGNGVGLLFFYLSVN